MFHRQSRLRRGPAIWLATALALTLLAAACVGFLLHAGSSPRRAVESIGGQLVPLRPVAFYDKLLGTRETYALSLMGTSVDDGWLRRNTELLELPLESLFLDGTSLGDETLATLAESGSSLEALQMGITRVTDAGLPHLAALTSLKRVRLDETAVTDAGLSALSNHPTLEQVTLSRCAITDVGLAILAQNDRWLGLDLSATDITDAGLEHLTRCPKLLVLELKKTDTGDAAAHLAAELPHLQSLEVGRHFTDAGLERLTQIAAPLQTVGLRNCRVTDEAVRAFQRRRPACNILHPLFDDPAPHGTP